MKNKNVDMLSGSIMRGLLSLTIPIMVSHVAQSLFHILDSAVLKSFGFESAVGAVGACGTLITLFTTLLTGIAAGGNVVVARHTGARNKQRAQAAIMTSLLFAVVSGLVLMGVGFIFAKIFLQMTNCHESLLRDAVVYFRIYFLGLPILMLYSFSVFILRALGDTKRPMYYLFINCTCKVVFTVVFLKLWGRGVESVAIATVAANTIACVLSTAAVLKNKEYVNLSRATVRFDRKELKAILYNGVPAGLQSGMYSFANVIIATVVNSFGADATTGIAIANQFDGVLYQIITAPPLAVIPYIAQNMGAGNVKRAKQAIFSAIFITVAFGASLGSLSAIFSRELSGILSSSPAVIEYSRQKMVVVSSLYFICGINEVLGGVLKGMGKPIYPALASLVFMCLFRFVWVYAIFPLRPNLSFLYTVWPVGWILSIITLVIILIPTVSKMEKSACASEKT